MNKIVFFYINPIYNRNIEIKNVNSGPELRFCTEGTLIFSIL